MSKSSSVPTLWAKNHVHLATVIAVLGVFSFIGFGIFISLLVSRPALPSLEDPAELVPMERTLALVLNPDERLQSLIETHFPITFPDAELSTIAAFALVQTQESPLTMYVWSRSQTGALIALTPIPALVDAPLSRAPDFLRLRHAGDSGGPAAFVRLERIGFSGSSGLSQIITPWSSVWMEPEMQGGVSVRFVTKTILSSRPIPPLASPMHSTVNLTAGSIATIRTLLPLWTDRTMRQWMETTVRSAVQSLFGEGTTPLFDALAQDQSIALSLQSSGSTITRVLLQSLGESEAQTTALLHTLTTGAEQARGSVIHDVRVFDGKFTANYVREAGLSEALEREWTEGSWKIRNIGALHFFQSSSAFMIAWGWDDVSELLTLPSPSIENPPAIARIEMDGSLLLALLHPWIGEEKWTGAPLPTGIVYLRNLGNNVTEIQYHPSHPPSP